MSNANGKLGGKQMELIVLSETEVLGMVIAPGLHRHRREYLASEKR